MTVTEFIKANPEVFFASYRNGCLFYYGNWEGYAFYFRVPTEELGDAKVNVTEKSVTLLKWIRRQIEEIHRDE